MDALAYRIVPAGSATANLLKVFLEFRRAQLQKHVNAAQQLVEEIPKLFRLGARGVALGLFNLLLKIFPHHPQSRRRTHFIVGLVLLENREIHHRFVRDGSNEPIL